MRLFAISFLGLAIAACGSTHAVHIRHPLQVGQVDPNSVPFESTLAERERGLPGGVLVDEASLTEVTPERLCVHTRLWSVETNPERGIYQNYQMTLLNDQDGVENSQAQVSAEAPTTTPMQGSIARTVPDGYRSVCVAWARNGGCTSYQQQMMYRTYYEPHVWQVTSYPAALCFPNGGFVTPSTTRVSLEFNPAAGGGNFVFQWLLDSAVAQSAPGTQQPGQPPQQQQPPPQQQSPQPQPSGQQPLLQQPVPPPPQQ